MPSVISAMLEMAGVPRSPRLLVFRYTATKTAARTEPTKTLVKWPARVSVRYVTWRC
jgi:hypothetical protein